jgi:hypothetical protein
MSKFKVDDFNAMTTPMSKTMAPDVDEEGEHVD